MIGRREFMAGLGSAAAWPVVVRAQQRTMPVIGFLRSTPLAPLQGLVTAFGQGLKEAGFVEGQNVAIEYRYADNQVDRLPTLVAELIRLRAAVIVVKPSQQPRRYRSSSQAGSIRSRPASSPA